MTAPATSTNPFENNPFQNGGGLLAAAPAAQATAPVEQAAPAPAAQPAAQAAPAAQPAAQPVADGGGVGIGDPFAMPSGGGSTDDADKIQAQVGYLLICKPTEFLPKFKTSIGETDTVRLDFVVLDGPNQGKRVDEALAFNKPLVRDLRKVYEGPSPYLLGRLERGVAKAGQSAPYIFTTPTETDVTLARQYLATTAL